MLPRLLICDPPEYKPHDVGLTDRPYEEGGLLIQYDPWLHDGDYQESIAGIIGIWLQFRDSAPSKYVYTMLTSMNQVRWPGWSTETWLFDSVSGEYLGRKNDPEEPGGSIGLFTTQLSHSRNGEIWLRDLWQTYRRIDPETYASTGETRPPGFWWVDDGQGGQITAYGAHSFLFDRVANRCLGFANGLGIGTNQLGVFDFTTGELLSKVFIVGRVVQVYWEGRNTAHVVNNMGVVTIINYAKSVVLGVFRHTLSPNETNIRFAYDQVHNRLLKASYTPDEVGTLAATTHIDAYDALPKPTKITQPLPMAPPRKGSVITVASRVLGDSGESFSGREVVVSSEVGPATVYPTKMLTDSFGWANLNCSCDDTGVETIDMDTETPDGI